MLCTVPSSMTPCMSARFQERAGDAQRSQQLLLLHAVTILAAVCLPALWVAGAAVSAWGVASLLLVLPALWLAVGCALCAACVLTSRLLLPQLSLRRPLKMYSAAFARWWLVRASWTHAP